MNAPFAPGDRVVKIAEPQDGERTVTRCYRHPTAGWRVEWSSLSHRGCRPVTGSERGDRFVLSPAGWRAPPPLPMSRYEFVLLYDNRPAFYREIETERRAGAIQDRAAAYRALAAWNDEVASLVNPELAAEQSEAYRQVADEIERELGR